MLWLPITFGFAQLVSGLTLRQTQACNGKAEYCSKKYADMVFIGVGLAAHPCMLRFEILIVFATAPLSSKGP